MIRADLETNLFLSVRHDGIGEPCGENASLPQLSRQRQSALRVARQQRNHGVLAGQCFAPELEKPRLEARRHGPQMLEQSQPSRTVQDVDRSVSGGSLGGRDWV